MKRLRSDIQAVRERDPACRGSLEVLLCYPGFKALRWYRFAHFLWRHKWYLPARFISHLSQVFTAVDIHPGAVIGDGVFIDHGTGVVIGETAVVGNNVIIYQGAVLGGTGKDSGKRHPTIEDNVVIASGAKVLGPFTVGKGSKIGAGAVVLREVPPYSTVVGIPGRVVRRRNCDNIGESGLPKCVETGEKCGNQEECPAIDEPEDNGKPDDAANGANGNGNGNGVDLDQIHLPDPVAIELNLLKKRVKHLEEMISSIEQTKQGDGKDT